MTKYGYCRAASNSENSLEIQKQKMQQVMCDEIVAEVRSGNKEPSDVFVDLLNRLKKGDTLVVTNIERLSRSLRERFEITNQLFEKGVRIHALNTGFLEAKELNLISAIFETISGREMEREVLSRRIKEGKAAAKKRRESEKQAVLYGRVGSSEQLIDLNDK